MKKKLIAIFLMALMICALPLNVFAAEVKMTGNREVYTDEELGLTVERTIDAQGKVTVTAKSLDGEILHTAVNDNGRVYLDGEEVNFVAGDGVLPAPTPPTIPSVAWGPWQESYNEISGVGAVLSVVAALISFYAPGVSWPIVLEAAALLIDSGGGILGIRTRIRYQSDDTYYYYERESTFYLNGSYISGPHADSGKTHLKKALFLA